MTGCPCVLQGLALTSAGSQNARFSTSRLTGKLTITALEVHSDGRWHQAVPAMVLGQLVGVLAIESEQRLAFTPDDEALLLVIATLIASAIEIDAAYERAEGANAVAPKTATAPAPERPSPTAPPRAGPAGSGTGGLSAPSGGAAAPASATACPPRWASRWPTERPARSA